MKTTLKEEIKNFKRLLGEATDSSSSGSYEQALGFDMPRQTTICPTTGRASNDNNITIFAAFKPVIFADKKINFFLEISFF